MDHALTVMNSRVCTGSMFSEFSHTLITSTYALTVMHSGVCTGCLVNLPCPNYLYTFMHLQLCIQEFVLWMFSEFSHTLITSTYALNNSHAFSYCYVQYWLFSELLITHTYS